MELFERVRVIARHLSGSDSALAEALAIRQNTFSYYLSAKTQTKLWELLPRILELYPQVNRDWLYFGEGEMLRSTAPFTPAEKYPHMNPAAVPGPQTLPLIGFAACGVGGWHGTMTIPVPVELPQWHPDMVAVMATGESMLPAGIGHGHICYCDPTKQPAPGEAVYVEQRDDTGTLKLFLGRSERGGAKFVNLRGWLDKKPGETAQKPFNLDVVESHVRLVAPVIYVRRRL